MFETDEELIENALDLWSNYIETGYVNLSAYDIINSGKDRQLIKRLTEDQRKLVMRIRTLRDRYKSHA